MSGEEAVQNLCISCGNAALYFYKLFFVFRGAKWWAFELLRFCLVFCEEDGRLSCCDFLRSTNEAKYANLSWFQIGTRTCLALRRENISVMKIWRGRIVD